MNDLNIISDVIIPIVASFIGGILTLGGVIITINTQKKKDIEDKKLRIKLKKEKKERKEKNKTKNKKGRKI